jgi:pimeloyl-ACP methyl ester carboxylesterase
MSGLRPPPKESTGRAVGRIVFLIFLLIALAFVIWAAVVNQRIPLVENLPFDEVDTANAEIVDGVSLHVEEQGNGTTPVFLLHDFDITGSSIFTDLLVALGEQVRVVRVDLPGYGLSSRIPGEDQGHTVASMASRVAAVITARSDVPVVVAGVGLGGEVAAEIAVTNPDLVASLVMIDVDFYSRRGWVEVLEGIPWVGTAATFAFDASGSFSESHWAPYCESGGWCPTEPIRQARTLAASLEMTTESLNGFVNTPPASDVPSRLGDIAAPALYIWSEQGGVPEDSVDEVVLLMPNLTVTGVDAFQAHLEEPTQVADLIAGMIP